MDYQAPYTHSTPMQLLRQTVFAQGIVSIATLVGPHSDRLALATSQTLAYLYNDGQPRAFLTVDAIVSK